MTAPRPTACLLVGGCLLLALLGHRFGFVGPAAGTPAPATAAAAAPAAARLQGAGAEQEETTAFSSLARLAAGFAAGAALLGLVAAPARAEVEDFAIPVDGKGKTTNLTKEELIRGKRLFNAACSVCHVGGGTRTNQSVGLGIEELSGAFPPRNTIDSLVSFINAPTTYDGLKDISEVHPSIIAADLWPKMRSMKQQDLYDISAYILYQNYVIPEKWGGGKQYY